MEKQDKMSPGEQTLAYASMLKPVLHAMFNSKDKLESMKIKIIDESLSDVCYLDCMAHMLIICLDNLMNRRKKVTSNNIEKLESQLKKCMTYFEDWQNDREEIKNKLHPHQLKMKQ